MCQVAPESYSLEVIALVRVAEDAALADVVGWDDSIVMGVSSC